MTHGDDERLLEEALRSVADDYVRRNPPDLAAARSRVGRLRRRRQVRTGSAYALATAAAVAVAVLAWPGADVRDGGPAPAERRDLPEGAVTIRVGEDPSEVAVGGGAVWVSDAADGTVTRIDPTTNEVAATVNVDGGPGDLAIGGGAVWVATPDSGLVQRIDAATSGRTPDVRVDLGPAGARLDLAIDRFLWVSVVGGDLLQLDRDSGEVLATIPGLSPVNVAARDGAVFVLGSDGVVRGIDPLTGAPNAIRLPFDVSGRGDVHYQEGRLWVADGLGSDLFSVDVSAGSQRVSTYGFRGTYVEMAHVTEGVLVLSDVGSSTGLLTLVDPATGDATELAEIDGRPRDVVAGAADLWVSTSDTDDVVRIPWPLDD